ncbi:MAG: glycoside hydrolase family 97 N-terminal domain-containing protein, partial [Planctomycetota bacterium]
MSCTAALAADAGGPATVTSPDGRIQVAAGVLADGTPYYRVDRDGAAVILPSMLGYEVKQAKPLRSGFAISSHATQSIDETWRPLWGEVAEIRNHYNELTVKLREKAAPHREMQLVFRVYDDGIGFRYELP